MEEKIDVQVSAEVMAERRRIYNRTGTIFGVLDVLWGAGMCVLTIVTGLDWLVWVTLIPVWVICGVMVFLAKKDKVW